MTERKRKVSKNFARQFCSKMKNRNTSISLPINRRQLFRFTYRTQFALLLNLSLLTALFALPYFAVICTKTVLEETLLSQFVASGDESYYIEYLSRSIFYDMFDIPAFLILSIGLTGGFGLIKAYVFGDGYTFWRTFFGSIRACLKQTLPASFFFALAVWLIRFSRNYIAMNSIVWYAPMTLAVAVVQLLLLCVWLFFMCQVHIYTGSCFRLIKNSFLFTGRYLFGILGVSVISIAPVLWGNVFENLTVYLVIIACWTILLFGNGILVTTLYCHHCFDRLINRERYPQIYHKGLFKEEDDNAAEGK